MPDRRVVGVVALSWLACTPTGRAPELSVEMPPAQMEPATGQPTGSAYARRDDVRAFIGRQIGELEACRASLRERRPGEDGKATMRVMLAPDGRVETFRLTDVTVGDEAFRQCLAGAVRAWPFPPPRPEEGRPELEFAVVFGGGEAE